MVLIGSAPLLMKAGMDESLAGRFETIRFEHWSYLEMAEAFGFTLDQYVYFGGCPGAAGLVGDPDRWGGYVRSALIEPSIERDVLEMQRVDKPALLRQLFEFGSRCSGQILSYNKMLGHLQDAGNTTTLTRYLHLLSQAGLLTGLSNHTGGPVSVRASTPKLNVLDTAFMAAVGGYSFDEARADRSHWGRMVESSVGAHLVNTASSSTTVKYWRHRNDEVDFVLQRGPQPGRDRGEERSHACEILCDFGVHAALQPKGGAHRRRRRDARRVPVAAGRPLDRHAMSGSESPARRACDGVSVEVPRTCRELREVKGPGSGVEIGEPRPLSEFRSVPAYVLLGDPGAGKTFEFDREQEALGDDAAWVVSARDFRTFDLDSRPQWRDKTLFIDGLDEARAGSTDSRAPFDEISRQARPARNVQLPPLLPRSRLARLERPPASPSRLARLGGHGPKTRSPRRGRRGRTAALEAPDRRRRRVRAEGPPEWRRRHARQPPDARPAGSSGQTGRRLAPQPPRDIGQGLPASFGRAQRQPSCGSQRHATGDSDGRRGLPVRADAARRH